MWGRGLSPSPAASAAALGQHDAPGASPEGRNAAFSLESDTGVGLQPQGGSQPWGSRQGGRDGAGLASSGLAEQGRQQRVVMLPRACAGDSFIVLEFWQKKHIGTQRGRDSVNTESTQHTELRQSLHTFLSGSFQQRQGQSWRQEQRQRSLLAAGSSPSRFAAGSSLTERCGQQQRALVLPRLRALL